MGVRARSGLCDRADIKFKVGARTSTDGYMKYNLLKKEILRREMFFFFNFPNPRKIRHTARSAKFGKSPSPPQIVLEAALSP